MNLDSKNKFNFKLENLSQETVLNIILSLIILALIGYSFFFYHNKHQQKSNTVSNLNNQDSTPSKVPKNTMSVDIEGAVINPGLYELEENSRIDDLLKLAGGFTKDADYEFITKKLNKADKLKDGLKIYIPRQGESFTPESSQTSTESTTAINTEEAEETDIGSNSSLVNINTASKNELDELPGIGEVSAESIINARPYTSIEELTTKKILTNSRFENIKDLITI